MKSVSTFFFSLQICSLSPLIAWEGGGGRSMGKGPGDQAAVYPAYVVVSPQDLGLQPGKVIDSHSVLFTTEQAASD